MVLVLRPLPLFHKGAAVYMDEKWSVFYDEANLYIKAKVHTISTYYDSDFYYTIRAFLNGLCRY